MDEKHVEDTEGEVSEHKEHGKELQQREEPGAAEDGVRIEERPFLTAKKRRRHTARMTSFGVRETRDRSSCGMSGRKWKQKDLSTFRRKD
jgi:hypothetical protein